MRRINMNRIRGKSLSHIIAFLRSRLLVGRILNTIDLNQFRAYQERFRDADPRPHGYSKYLDIRYWMVQKLMHFFLLGLDRAKPLRVLDIGTGPGYFPLICSVYGHKAVAIDLGVIPMYNELCQFLKIDRRTWRIEKFQQLPNLGMKFDLITAFMIKFNRHYLPDLWSVDEWRFLLEDLSANQLNENGRIFLQFNANHDGSYYDDKTLEYFRTLGARVYRDQVDIRGPIIPY